MTQKINFDFIEFIESKGFTKLNNNNFEYILENSFHLQLILENNEYVIPFTPEKQFRTKIPTNKETAEKSFITIAEILNITFNK